MFTRRAILAFVVACGGDPTSSAYGEITIARNGGGYTIFADFTDSPPNAAYTVSTVGPCTVFVRTSGPPGQHG